MPPRSRDQFYGWEPHPFILLTLILQFFNALILLGLLGYIEFFSILLRCCCYPGTKCRALLPWDIILPIIILSNCLVLALTWYELCSGLEELLTITRFLYYEIAKIMPVSAFLIWLAINLVHSTTIEMWVWSLFLIPAPFFVALVAAIALNYRDWRTAMVLGDEERPSLAGQDDDGSRERASLIAEPLEGE